MAIFVSYSRQDRSKVELIVDILMRRGETVWWDRDLEPGAAFGDEIQRQLDAATSIVVVWSNSSVASSWVRSEASYGHDKDKLIPVALDSVAIPVPFNSLDTIDLSAWPNMPLQDEIARLVAAAAQMGSAETLQTSKTAPDTSLSVRVARRVREGLAHNIPRRLDIVRDQISDDLFRLYRHASAQLNQLTDDSCARAATMCEELGQRGLRPEYHLNLHSRALWYGRIVRDQPAAEGNLSASLPLNMVVKEGRIEELRVLLTGAMRSPDTEVMLQMAIFLLLPLGLYELAKSYLEKVVRQEPLLAEARFHLARSAALQKNWRECLDALDMLIDASPDSELALTYRALVLTIVGNVPAGLTDFEQMIRSGGGHWLSTLGSECIVSSDKHAAAEAAWRRLEERVARTLMPNGVTGDAVNHAAVADDARLKLIALEL